MASRRLSASVRVKSETQSSERQAGTTPEVLKAPRVGFHPTRLLKPAGTRPEPAPRNPAYTAARVRLALLATVVIVATLTSARGCNKPEPRPVPPAPSTEPDPERHIVPVDVSLG